MSRKEIFLKMLRKEHRNWSKLWNKDLPVVSAMKRIGWQIPGAVDYSHGARLIYKRNTNIKLHIGKNWIIEKTVRAGAAYTSLEIWDNDIFRCYQDVYS